MFASLSARVDDLAALAILSHDVEMGEEASFDCLAILGTYQFDLIYRLTGAVTVASRYPP